MSWRRTKRTGTDRMNLPQGMTCSDCVHFGRCSGIFGHIESDEVCDWSPSKFVPRFGVRDVVELIPSPLAGEVSPTRQRDIDVGAGGETEMRSPQTADCVGNESAHRERG